MNLPCKDCITLPICIASIINKGDIWCEKSLLSMNGSSSQHDIVSTFQYFQDAVMDMLREKCSIFKNYFPRPRLQEYLTHDEWEERRKSIYQFFKKYYPIYNNTDVKNKLYKSIHTKIGKTIKDNVKVINQSCQPTKETHQ